MMKEPSTLHCHGDVPLCLMSVVLHERHSKGKDMRDHSSEKIEELVTELEGYRWDAILLSETWRHEPAELWEIHHNHIFMGAGKYENKHGVESC